MGGRGEVGELLPPPPRRHNGRGGWIWDLRWNGSGWDFVVVASVVVDDEVRKSVTIVVVFEASSTKALLLVVKLLEATREVEGLVASWLCALGLFAVLLVGSRGNVCFDRARRRVGWVRFSCDMVDGIPADDFLLRSVNR